MVVRVQARGQKLEYIWCDGQEGQEIKVRNAHTPHNPQPRGCTVLVDMV
jgi:hypothetical protein